LVESLADDAAYPTELAKSGISLFAISAADGRKIYVHIDINRAMKPSA